MGGERGVYGEERDKFFGGNGEIAIFAGKTEMKMDERNGNKGRETTGAKDAATSSAKDTRTSSPFSSALAFLCEGCPIDGLGEGDSKVSARTEAVMAERICERMSQGWFRRNGDIMYAFDGRRYVVMSDNDMESLMCELLKVKGVGEVYLTGSITKLTRRAMREWGIPPFRPSRGVVSFRNCVLELDTGMVAPHSQEWETRIYLDFDYYPYAKCPRWTAFLDEVLGDVQTISVLQEFLGLIFVDRKVLSVEKMLFLFGYGSNGKSVVHDTVKYILGDNCSEFTMEQLCGRQNSDYYAAQANGKLLNFASDLGDSDFSGGRFKAIVSAEPIVVRPIGKAPYQADEMPLLAANVNKMPVTTDSSNGHWRRPIIIEFTRTIEESQQDRRLKFKLQDEASGIFNWILVGRERILRNEGRFTESTVIRETVQRLREESSSVLSFLAERRYVCKSDSEADAKYMHVVELMEEYNEYCRDYGNSPKGRTGFITDLRQLGFSYLPKLRKNGKVTTGFKVYELHDEGEVFDGSGAADDDFPF